LDANILKTISKYRFESQSKRTHQRVKAQPPPQKENTKYFQQFTEIVLLNNQAAQIEPVLELTQTPREEKTMALRTTAELNNGVFVTIVYTLAFSTCNPPAIFVILLDCKRNS